MQSTVLWAGTEKGGDSLKVVWIGDTVLDLEGNPVLHRRLYPDRELIDY